MSHAPRRKPLVSEPQTIRRRALLVVLAAAVCGVALAALSTARHSRITRDGLEHASYCAISEKINCDLVNASSYSEVLGVPAAWWGLVFYLIVAGIALVALVSRLDERPRLVLVWLMSVAGLVYCFFLSYVSVFVLEIWCLECVAMYAVNLAFVVFLFLALGVPVRNAPAFLREYGRAVVGLPSRVGFSPDLFPHGLWMVVIFLLGWTLIAIVQAGEPGRDRSLSVDEKVEDFYRQPERPVVVDPGWTVWGNPKARVTIVEFSEFQCPYCRHSAFRVKPYLQEFRDEVRYYFVNYPLDYACNDRMTRPMHPLGCFAAKAGICAEQLGDFWAYHDELFRKQRTLSRKDILEAAQERGWGRERFLACMNSEEVQARLHKEIKQGERIGLTGTPTLFLNNRRLRHWRDHRFVRRIVAEEIRRNKRVAKGTQ